MWSASRQRIGNNCLDSSCTPLCVCVCVFTYSRFHFAWELLFSVALFWVLWRIPFVLAFRPDTTRPLQAVDFAFTLFLMLDVLYNFRTLSHSSCACSHHSPTTTLPPDQCLTRQW